MAPTKPAGRRSFVTTVEAPPPPRPAELSAKTRAEQQAGRAKLAMFDSVPESTPAKEG